MGAGCRGGGSRIHVCGSRPRRCAQSFALDTTPAAGLCTRLVTPCACNRACVGGHPPVPKRVYPLWVGARGALRRCRGLGDVATCAAREPSGPPRYAGARHWRVAWACPSAAPAAPAAPRHWREKAGARAQSQFRPGSRARPAANARQIRAPPGPPGWAASRPPQAAGAQAPPGPLAWSDLRGLDRKRLANARHPGPAGADVHLKPALWAFSGWVPLGGVAEALALTPPSAS